MSVPRKKIIDRLNQNVDNLLKSGADLVKNLYLSEIASPFRSTGKSGESSPFLKSLFPEIRTAAVLERSLNTALGWGWDKIVGDIAQDTHGNATVGYIVEGRIPTSTANMIEQICMAYTSGEGHISPDLASELSSIMATVGTPGSREDVREKDDVFFVANDGTANHVEVKTAKPNYDQTRAAKRRILRIYAALPGENVKVFIGMAYNPNGYFSPYGWPTTRYFLDERTDLLVGKDFWNYVGDSADTYDDLLDIFATVAVNRHRELIRLLK